ncbi:MAG TPA: hypothetical protein VGA90_04470 [Methylomirabilota bacterium]|jgi:hypothetical protein
MTARARIGVLAVAGAWWLVLAVAFLLNRGEDVGRLPALMSTSLARLAHEPVWGPAGIQSLVGLLIAGLIGLAWYGLGAAIVRSIDLPAHGEPGDPPVMQIAERSLAGAGAWSLAWFFLGVLPLYRASVAALALLVGLALAGRAVARVRITAGDIARTAGWGALSLVVTGQILALVAALAPPTAKDTLLYHYALPKAWIAAGRAIEIPYNIAGYYPLGVEMHAVWAMLLGAPLGARVAEAAAGATLFLFAPLLVMTVYGWARERGADRAWAATAALVIAWIPSAYEVAASAYVDLALAGYTALAVRAFGRWWVSGQPGQLAWVAAGIGGALSIKLSAAFLLLPLALLGLLHALGAGSQDREAARPTTALTAAGVLGALALGVTLAAPWYVRNWIRTGSPLFPFYLEIWPAQAPGWDLERSRLYETLFSLYGDVRGPLDYLWSPIRLAVAAQPDQPAFYDGVLGIVFVLALPLLAWALWRRHLDVELRLAVLISAGLFVFWLFSSQQLRYLLPAAAGLAVAIAVAGSGLDRGLSRPLCGLVVAGAALGLPVVLAWFLALDPARVVLGGEPRDAFLARRLDYYPYYQVVNRDLPPTATVWLIDMRRDTYHLDRPAFSDFIFEDYTLTRYVRTATSVDEIRARVRADGITHLLVRHDILLDYERSPIVDERRPRQENVAKLELMTAFFTQDTRVIKGDRKFWLIELPPARPY